MDIRGPSGAPDGYAWFELAFSPASFGRLGTAEKERSSNSKAEKDQSLTVDFGSLQPSVKISEASKAYSKCPNK